MTEKERTSSLTTSSRFAMDVSLPGHVGSSTPRLHRFLPTEASDASSHTCGRRRTHYDQTGHSAAFGCSIKDCGTGSFHSRLQTPSEIDGDGQELDGLLRRPTVHEAGMAACSSGDRLRRCLRDHPGKSRAPPGTPTPPPPPPAHLVGRAHEPRPCFRRRRHAPRRADQGEDGRDRRLLAAAGARAAGRASTSGRLFCLLLWSLLVAGNWVRRAVCDAGSEDGRVRPQGRGSRLWCAADDLGQVTDHITSNPTSIYNYIVRPPSIIKHITVP
ncbi:hypothetical protein GW17_00019380 [Ensete ventricosum]|nr:hypothetical protein GW17_00019380 [Ensete ventricosum]